MFEHKDGTPANFAERAKDTYFDDPSELFQNMDAVLAVRSFIRMLFSRESLVLYKRG